MAEPVGFEPTGAFALTTFPMWPLKPDSDTALWQSVEESNP